MEETGLVVEKIAGKAKVHFKAKHACVSCENASSCIEMGRDKELEVSDNIGVSVGQTVLVKINNDKLFLGLSLIYLFPTIIFFMGILIGNLFIDRNKDIASLSIGFFLLFLYFLILKSISKQFKNNFIPSIIRIVES